MADTNYGSLFTKGGSMVGKCMVVDFPEVTVSNIDGTNHQSGGIEERFPGGIRRVSEFTVEMVVESGVMEAINSDLEGKVVDECVLTLGDIATITFSGFYTGFKPEPADVGSEDIGKASVTVQPTSGLTIVSL